MAVTVSEEKRVTRASPHAQLCTSVRELRQTLWLGSGEAPALPRSEPEET